MHMIEHGFAVMGWHLKLGVRPDECVYNILLNGLICEGKVSEAVSMFNSISKPDVYMCSTMIKGLCMYGHIARALDFLNRMDVLGIPPNNVSYSTVTHNLMKDKLSEEAFNMFRKMCSRGIKPTAVTYSSMLHELCKLGHYLFVEAMLKEMKAQDISLDLCTYSALLDAYDKNDDTEKADALLKKDA
ncbi:hypothetical protein QVD17_13201 [Tagetes erecta]|uniref:Pentatricopeptide repeat-containing protein n=1 Tax=Tagetes erecta TaxID=13708 RepID=A0AAD8KVT7_TARER|nr:hypothetical protein QVD17_13201 [Tagetes erecta]